MSQSINTDGNASFVELRGSIFEIYRASVNTVRANAPFQTYHITEIADYYPGILNEMLWSHESIQKLSLEYRGLITGKTDRKINCVLLLNGSPEEGILLHDTGEKLVCAYFPIITHDYFNRYEHALHLLETVAQSSEGIMFYLPQDIQKGQKSLRELVKILIAQLK